VEAFVSPRIASIGRAADERRYPWSMAVRAAGEVIVVGSANVDMTVRTTHLPTPGETVIGGSYSRRNGGKGANQAVAAATYGASTRLIAAVGDDPLADSLIDGLRSAGVETGGIARLSGAATGVAFIVVDARGENQIAVASGANDRLSASLVTAALTAIEPAAGSICLVGFEIGDPAILAAATWAVGTGVRLIVNPAPARPLPSSLDGMTPLLTPNRGEATVLTGLADPGAAADALRRRTGAPVVITLGGDGALVRDERGSVHIQAAPVTPLDTTGAGDVFNGILAAELAAGTTLRSAVRLATNGASIATRAPGAQAGLPSRADVLRASEAAGDRS
jgi:ribokinase